MKHDTLQDHEFRRDEWAARERDMRVHRCPAQACCLLEGHTGNHRCSVCNWPHRLDATESDVLASETYEAHECYPPNDAEPGFVADPNFGRVDVEAPFDNSGIKRREDEDADFASTPHPSAHYERTEQ